MKNTFDKITGLVRSPGIVADFSSQDWNRLISQARYHDLLPFVYRLLEFNDLLEETPEQVLEILTGYINRLAYKHTIYLWESRKINDLIEDLNYPVVLLKGMAYLQDRVSTYSSRDFNDIDLLVDDTHFADFEQILLSNGWRFKALSAYDEQYYREWSHASPPLVNRQSGLELDLHHHISSPLQDEQIDTDLVLADLVKIDGCRYYRLSDIDTVLHCANHFIYLDIVQGKLKDLLFIYYLIPRQSTRQFWQELLQRAQELGQETAMYYLVRLLDEYFAVNTSHACLNELIRSRKSWAKSLVYICLKSCICPVNPDGLRTRLAGTFLTMRYQWLQYPLKILVYHIVKKHVLMKLAGMLNRIS